MKYCNLGRTGVQVSQLCLGTMNFGLRATEAESIPVIDHAIEQGINFIDTANIYGLMPTKIPMGEGPGRSEEIIGKALKQNGKRDRIILATKFFNKVILDDVNGGGRNGGGASRRHIMQQVEASLRRLQTDYIDLYQIHRPDPSVPIDETLRALDDLVTSGKVRYIGTSGFDAWHFVEALWESSNLQLNRFISEQPHYSLINRRVEVSVLPMAQKYEIAILPWSPLAMGFLTGKYQRDQEKPAGSRFTTQINWLNGLSDQAYDLLDLLQEMAQQKEATVSQVALAWVMNQPGVTAPIIGPRTIQQLDDNLGALQVHFDEADFAQIDAIAKPMNSLWK